MYLPMLSDDELVRFVESNTEATDCEKRLAARIVELQTEANEMEVAAEHQHNAICRLEEENEELSGDIATLKDEITNLKKHY
jgi:peptidoglycan hydrolase CwlO-like protein